VLCDGLGGGFWRSDNLHAMLCGGLNVDVVHAGSVAPHDLESGGMFENAPRHTPIGAHHNAIDIRNLFYDGVLVGVADHTHLTNRAKHVHASLVHGLIEKEPEHVSIHLSRFCPDDRRLSREAICLIPKVNAPVRQLPWQRRRESFRWFRS